MARQKTVEMHKLLAARTFHPDARQKVVGTVAVVVLVMLVADLLMLSTIEWVQTPRFWGTAWWIQKCLIPLMVGLIVGFFGSQLFLAVLYSALGDGSSPKRVLYTTFAMTVFTNVLVLFNMWWFRVGWGDAIGGFLSPILVFFLLQIPLWGIRSFFGWMIKSPWSKSRAQPRMRFTLAHLLGWSVFLAVPLTIMQAIQFGPAGSVLLALCGWILVLSALLVSFVYLTLAADIGVWRLIATATVVLFLAIATQLVALRIWVGGPGVQPVVMLTTAQFSGGAVVLLCLTLAHRLGFQLVTYRTRPDGGH